MRAAPRAGSTAAAIAAAWRGHAVLPGVVVVGRDLLMIALPVHQGLVQAQLAVALALGAQHLLELVPKRGQARGQRPGRAGQRGAHGSWTSGPAQWEQDLS